MGVMAGAVGHDEVGGVGDLERMEEEGWLES